MMTFAIAEKQVAVARRMETEGEGPGKLSLGEVRSILQQVTTASEKLRLRSLLAKLNRSGTLVPAARDAAGLAHQINAGSLIIVPDTPLSDVDRNRLVDRSTDAFDFSAQQQALSSARLHQDPTVLLAINDALFDEYSGGRPVAAGTNGDTVTMRSSSINDPHHWIDDTLAHEVTHAQDRLLWRDALVPDFLSEGIATVIGIQHRRNLEAPGYVDHRAEAAGARSVTDAKTAFFDGKYTGLDERVGSLFVEYLRTKMNGDGVADAIPRLAKTLGLLGDGLDPETAFQRQFGLTLRQAQDRFIEWLAATEGKPTERLRGTVWEMT